MRMLKEFKEFALRGNVVDMAIGIIIGGAFGTIVKSLVEDIIMPPISLLLGRVDFTNLFLVLREGKDAAGPYMTVADAHKAGAVTLNYGNFITGLISFLIVAWAVFMLVRTMNKLLRSKKDVPAPTSKECPYCFSSINIKATKCPSCTSTLPAA